MLFRRFVKIIAFFAYLLDQVPTMDRSNVTLHSLETDRPSFGALTHILLVLWFTAFLIMVADVLLLRNVWMRNRHNRRHNHSRHLLRMGRADSYEERTSVLVLQMPRLPYEMEGIGQLNRGVQYMYHWLPNGERVLVRTENVEDVGRRDDGMHDMDGVHG